MPPAVSALSEQMTTISENLEAAIDMSNLMLKYIPTDTLLYKNMSFMQKALFFASALNKGSYAVNGFGHTITVDDFFEIEEGEPPRKKARVVKSVPLAAGKKPQVAKKTQLSTGPKAGTSSDPTSEPGEGQGDVSDSESESEDVIHPLIEQDLYVYECYNVDIIDAHYNTKTNIKTCPLKNQCYCGEQFETQAEFTQHEKQHAGQAWACFDCGKQSKGNDKRATYKHYRTQHEYRHIHQCTFDGCSIDWHPFGNDKQYMVWWHMQEDHGLRSPLGCPKCDGTFCAKQTQQKHIATCPGKKAKCGPYGEKKYTCNECTKKYTTEAALKNHKKVHKSTDKKYVCSLCGKALGSTTALHRHEKIHQDH